MIAQRDDDVVDQEDACPRCSERHVDRLVWIEDGQRVRCATCLIVYVPPAARPSPEGGDDDGQAQ
jgi:hypothetical protein